MVILYGICIALTGCAIIRFGLFVWKKQWMKVVHGLLRKNVDPEDIPSLTKQLGIGYIVIGCGLTASGMLEMITQLTGSFFVSVPFMIIGSAMNSYAILKYTVK